MNLMIFMKLFKVPEQKQLMARPNQELFNKLQTNKNIC